MVYLQLKKESGKGEAIACYIKACYQCWLAVMIQISNPMTIIAYDIESDNNIAAIRRQLDTNKKKKNKKQNKTKQKTAKMNTNGPSLSGFRR